MLDCKNHFPISRCYGLSEAILSYYSILINQKKKKTTTNKTKNKTKQRKNKNIKQTNKKIRCKQQT